MEVQGIQLGCSGLCSKRFHLLSPHPHPTPSFSFLIFMFHTLCFCLSVLALYLSHCKLSKPLFFIKSAYLRYFVTVTEEELMEFLILVSACGFVYTSQVEATGIRSTWSWSDTVVSCPVWVLRTQLGSFVRAGPPLTTGTFLWPNLFNSLRAVTLSSEKLDDADWYSLG